MTTILRDEGLNPSVGVQASACSGSLKAGLQPDRCDALRRLQREMLEQTSAALSKSDLLLAMAQVAARCAEPLSICYFERNEQGELGEAIPLLPTVDESRGRRMAAQLAACCQSACREGELHVRRQMAPDRLLIAAPVPRRGRDPEAVGMIFGRVGQAFQPDSQAGKPDLLDQSDAQHLMLVQLIVSHIVLWESLADCLVREADAAACAALVELLDRLALAADVREACYTLAGALATYLQAARVVVGLRPKSKGGCRLAAISGVARFDHRSPAAQALEAALDEAVLRGEVTCWPPADASQRHAALAHKNLCAIENTPVAVSIPLYNTDGSALGAILVLEHEAGSHPRHSQRFLEAAGPSLAAALMVAQRLEGGRFRKLAASAARCWDTWKAKAALTAAALALAALWIPLPYTVRCDCRLEPVTRRFVAAPFEGVLEKPLVKPGDLVAQGEILARLDGREIRWKRASVAADQQQAAKKRDVAQAAHNYSDQQIAQLEIQRLELELKVLDHKAENLEIRSPVSGVVVSGDLERAEGAPLKIGQSMFEIAPLDKMIIEVAVPDDRISHVESGQAIEIRLDAYPDRTWNTVLTKIEPRSEIREQDNVFIAEGAIENAGGTLRPGMKGRAKIATPPRALGWILFHDPWDYVLKKLTW